MCIWRWRIFFFCFFGICIVKSLLQLFWLVPAWQKLEGYAKDVLAEQMENRTLRLVSTEQGESRVKTRWDFAAISHKLSFMHIVSKVPSVILSEIFFSAWKRGSTNSCLQWASGESTTADKRRRGRKFGESTGCGNSLWLAIVLVIMTICHVLSVTKTGKWCLNKSKKEWLDFPWRQFWALLLVWIGNCCHYSGKRPQGDTVYHYTKSLYLLCLWKYV